MQQKETKKGQLTVPKMTVSPTIAYEYLTEKRMIDREIVMECFAQKMIMEPQNHEVAFIGCMVYIIEGNSGDACKQNTYPVNSTSILGYGITEY